MNKLKEKWNNFWYEYIPDEWGSYGGTCSGKYRFREEYLIVVIVTITVIIALLC